VGAQELWELWHIAWHVTLVFSSSAIASTCYGIGCTKEEVGSILDGYHTHQERYSVIGTGIRITDRIHGLIAK